MKSLSLAVLLAVPASAASPGPDSASFVSESCGSLPTTLVVPALQAGLRCLRERGAGARVAEFERLLAPGRRVALRCHQDPSQHFAQAFPDEQPPRVDIGGGIVADLREKGPGPALWGTVFHEFVHLLDGRYHHGYTPGLPDMAVACEACCFGRENRAELAYVDGERMSEEDFAAQCRACASGSSEPDLPYRQRMAELSVPDQDHHALYAYLRAIADAGLGEAEQRRRLTGAVLPRLCRLEGLEPSVSALAPPVRDEILQACASTPRPRTKPEG